MHASLDDNVEYEALSYCWGPPDVPKKIYIGNTPLLIRSSLHEFLGALCQKQQSLPIWVDSVCINQHDVQERNWQVSMMGDIYRYARRVKSWIGPSDGHSEYAFAYINNYRDEASLSSRILARVKRKALESFQMLLNRPYWKRLWVVQKMALAQEILILCGSRTISWEVLVDAYEHHFPSSKHIINALRELKNSFNAAVTLKKRVPASAERLLEVDDGVWCWHDRCMSTPRPLVITEFSLLAQMSRFSAQACENPRDRIFGTLSIAENATRITVDYTKSLADVLMGIVLVAYHVSLMARPHLTTGYQHTVSRQKLDGFEKSINEGCLKTFVDDVTNHLLPTGLLADPPDLLCSLSNMEDCLGICPRSFTVSTNSVLPNENQYEGLLFDKRDMEKLEKKLCKRISLNPIFSALIHWESHEAAPRIIGSASRTHPAQLMYHLLLEIGEIQLCSQAQTSLLYAQHHIYGSTRHYIYESTICVFFLHLSPFALLTIICFEALKFKIATGSFEAIEACLRGRRGKYPCPELCDCALSAELNLEAFNAYERVNDGSWHGDDPSVPVCSEW